MNIIFQELLDRLSLTVIHSLVSDELKFVADLSPTHESDLDKKYLTLIASANSLDLVQIICHDRIRLYHQEQVDRLTKFVGSRTKTALHEALAELFKHLRDN